MQNLPVLFQMYIQIISTWIHIFVLLTFAAVAVPV